MNPQEFFRAARKGEPGPSYFFKGTELFIKNKALRILLDVIPEGQRAFNYDLFFGGDSELDVVLTAARTLPFLSPRRAVVLRDLDRVGAGSARAEMLVEYLRNPSPETIFVATTEDAGAARSWSKNSCSKNWATGS